MALSRVVRGLKPAGTDPVKRGEGLLADGFDGDGDDLFVAMGFQQGASVGVIALVPQSVGTGLVRRQQKNLMAKGFGDARPVVSRAAGLQQNRRRRPVGEEFHHLTPRETPALAHATSNFRHDNLEHGLGQIHGDGRMLLHGLLLSRAAMTPNHVGTQMPFTRWEESISSLQRTRARPAVGRSSLSFETFGEE